MAQEYNRSLPWIRKQILDYDVDEKTHYPREVLLICDATFYGKKKDKLGTLVFKDHWYNEVIIWKHIQSESVYDYKQLLEMVLQLGYEVKGIVIDGKRVLYKVFKQYPIQMCHFHQKKIIQRYITKNPKLQASKDLKKIVRNLTTTNQTLFIKKLDKWYKQYEEFLEQRTFHPDTGKESYTHYRLISAYKSLKTNLPYLFTYKNHKDLHMPNTTNNLDGGVFSPMKKLIKVHNGFTKSLKLKLVDHYLLNYKKNQ